MERHEKDVSPARARINWTSPGSFMLDICSVRLCIHDSECYSLLRIVMML